MEQVRLPNKLISYSRRDTNIYRRINSAISTHCDCANLECWLGWLDTFDILILKESVMWRGECRNNYKQQVSIPFGLDKGTNKYCQSPKPPGNVFCVYNYVYTHLYRHFVLLIRYWIVLCYVLPIVLPMPMTRDKPTRSHGPSPLDHVARKRRLKKWSIAIRAKKDPIARAI